MQGVIRSVFSNTLVLEVDEPPQMEAGTIVDVDIKVHRERRSRDANAYFHVLVDKLRQKLNMSFTSCKNMLITSYGQIEFIDDIPATVKTNIPPEYMREQETPHMKMIQVEYQNIQEYHQVVSEKVFWYRIYRGSHTYNTAEMAILIDGTVAECKELGIPTETPDQIAKMVQVWGEKYEENQKRCM